MYKFNKKPEKPKISLHDLLKYSKKFYSNGKYDKERYHKNINIICKLMAMDEEDELK